MSVPGRLTSAPLTVTGGAEGISAHLEDLEAVAAEFRAAAHEVDDIVAFAAAWALFRAPSYDLPVHAAADLALTTLSGPVQPCAAGRRRAARLRRRARPRPPSSTPIGDGVGVRPRARSAELTAPAEAGVAGR